MTSHVLKLDRLAELSARYARYSRSAGGLSTVFGGVLLLLVFAVNAFAELSTSLRIALAMAPLLWLAVKEMLRHWYYQRDGLAMQKPSVNERRQRLWWTIYLAVVSTAIVAVVVYGSRHQGYGLHLPEVGYIVMVATMPFVAWRWFWSASDFIVGVLLFCQAAVVLGGSQYPPLWLWYVGGCTVLVVAIGWREHRDYLRLRRELTGRADDQ